MLLTRSPLELCRKYSRACTSLSGNRPARGEGKAGRVDRVTERKGKERCCPASLGTQLTSGSVGWLESTVMYLCGSKNVDFLRKVFFLDGCWNFLLLDRVLFRFLILSFSCNLVLITGFSQNKTVGVGRRRKLVMMFSWCPIFDVWLNFKVSSFHLQVLYQAEHKAGSSSEKSVR